LQGANDRNDDKEQDRLRLPDALSLTPYTYDAYMSPVYEKAQSLTAPLK